MNFEKCLQKKFNFCTSFSEKIANFIKDHKKKARILSKNQGGKFKFYQKVVEKM